MHAEFGIDITEHLHDRTFRWFAVRVGWLLATDNPLARMFRKEGD